MEIRAREVCVTCSGTRILNDRDKPRFCPMCQDGYTYTWLDVVDLHILLARKPSGPEKPH